MDYKGSVENMVSKVGRNMFLRNLILAVCAVIVFVFIVAMLLNLFTRHNKYQDVPDFAGMSMEQAEKAGKKSDLVIELNDSLYVPTSPGGVVLDQFPKPGTHVKAGRRIFVTINASSRKMVKIPYVTGFSLRQAKNNLQLAGLEIERIIYREDIATNYVLEEQYRGAVITENSTKKAEQGTGVTLFVGLSPGEPLPAMPKFIGLTLNEAKSRIWEAGMNVGRITYDDNIPIMDRNSARIYRQSPEQMRHADPGTGVDLYLTLDEEKVRKNAASADGRARQYVESQEAQADAEPVADEDSETL